jgi:hypothetical protein
MFGGTGAGPTHHSDVRRTLLSPAPNAPPALSRSSQSRTDRVLTWIAVTLVVAGVILGVSKHGQPLVPRARELFIPGGLVLLVVAWRGRRRAPAACFWISLVALALIGVGAHEAVRGPWTLLAVPGAVLACLACLRSALKGPRDPFFERMRWARSGTRGSKPRSLTVTRMWLVFLAVILGCGAGFAVAAALAPGPTVDVQVVPVAYGLDTQAELFRLGVRNAHCSGGATRYTLAEGGFREWCDPRGADRRVAAGEHPHGDAEERGGKHERGVHHGRPVVVRRDLEPGASALRRVGEPVEDGGRPRGDVGWQPG